MKSQKIRLFIILTFLFLFSCSNSPKKSLLQLEVEQQAQQWFDSAFARCNDTFISKYQGREIQIGQSIGDSLDRGFLQFKNLSFTIEETALTEADKLNGIEWKGNITLLPVKPTVRYYELFQTPLKWSEWKEGVIIYSPDILGLKKEGTPSIRELKKVEGKWDNPGKPYGGVNDFTKTECTEIPKG